MNASGPAAEQLARVDDVDDIAALLDDIYEYHGYDFRDYSLASVRRRLIQFLEAEDLTDMAALRRKVIRDRECMSRLLTRLSVSVTAMFRDPGFHLAFRSTVVPLLRTYPYLRIWHAGCSSGQEVYSLAILLKETGLYDRCRIYATDINEAALAKAKQGAFPLAAMKEYTSNYLAAGGARPFSEYYETGAGTAVFDPGLRANVTFAQHNLASDGPFNEFHVVLCRNVMIYFNRALQLRVHELITNSLVLFGFVGLGSKESLAHTPYESRFKQLDSRERLYRKVR